MSDKEILILLAAVSALLYAYRRQWENVITRAVLVGVYFLVITDATDADTSMFLVRWSILLLLFVETLFSMYVIAAQISKTR